ncbi:MAG: DUF255 domain-containing protein [Pseudomonadota bacterium]
MPVLKLLTSSILLLVLTLTGAAAEGAKRLLKESSPYLRLHADNPVNWYPWGPEALAKAKAENKPIYLSVGYSTCHWCHVMERESFMDQKIAAYLNEHFIAIKVDRERRPDIDETFMLVTELMAQRGGWPNNVFLTPELTPFMGETYLPPEIFTQLITNVANRWKTNSKDMLAEAAQMQEVVNTVMQARLQAQQVTPEIRTQIAAHLSAGIDTKAGGTQGTPKFPNESLMLYLQHQSTRHDETAATKAVSATLDAIVRGGIHDHLGGGFHRYALDEKWNVPHFEKMLYNQALITRALVHSFSVTGNMDHATAARRALEFVLRDMTTKDGAFLSAFDAESVNAAGEKKEGAFYTWPHSELQENLSADELRLLETAYGVRFEGNFHAENVLHLSGDLPAHLKTLGLTEAEFEASVATIREKLLALRAKREAPYRDEKVLTGWNALMMRTMAEAGRIFHEPRYVGAALANAQYLWKNMRGPDGLLMRYRFEGKSELTATQQDYAFLANAFVSLYDAGAGADWLTAAEEVAAGMDQLFFDGPSGDYYFTTDEVEFSRPKLKTDVTLPSGNAAALELFARLARRSLKPEYGQRADLLSASISGLTVQMPASVPYSLYAADLMRNGTGGPLQYLGKGQVKASVVRSEPGKVRVRLQIAKGWHVNGHEVKNDAFIPTQITVGTRTSSLPAKISYPEYKLVKLGIAEEELALYEGDVEIEVDLKAGAKASPIISLEAQACNDEICLLPETVMLNVPPVAVSALKLAMQQ